MTQCRWRRGTPTGEEDARPSHGIEDFDEFNEALQGLFDWGDENRFIIK